MPAALTAAPEDDDLRQQLDQLIPPSTGSGLRLLVSTLVVAAAIGFLVLNIGGYLYPRPTFGASFGGNTLLQGDRDRGLVAAEIALPNYSQRSIRVTDVILEAPGAELVEVGLRLDEPIGDEVTTVASGLESVSEGATSIDLSRPASATPLPATIPPGPGVHRRVGPLGYRRGHGRFRRRGGPPVRQVDPHRPGPDRRTRRDDVAPDRR